MPGVQEGRARRQQNLRYRKERCVRLSMRYRHWRLHNQTCGSRLGSLYYGSTNLTMDLPAGLACEIDVGFVVEVTPLLFFRP